MFAAAGYLCFLNTRARANGESYYEMVSLPIDDLSLDDSGTRSFISLCHSEPKITLSAINDLLTTQPYKQMLRLMKPEFGLGQEQFALAIATALNPDEYALPKDLSGRYLCIKNPSGVMTWLQNLKKRLDALKSPARSKAIAENAASLGQT